MLKDKGAEAEVEQEGKEVEVRVELGDKEVEVRVEQGNKEVGVEPEEKATKILVQVLAECLLPCHIRNPKREQDLSHVPPTMRI